MNAKDNFLATQAKVDQAAIAPFPNSKKIHVLGTRADLRVPHASGFTVRHSQWFW